MKGLVLTVAVIAILAVVVTTRRGAGPSSPAPTAITDQIHFRDQAGLELRTRTQIDAMKQLTAMGSTAPQAWSPVLEANDLLRQDQARIAARLRQTGGDPLPPANWDEFLRLDAAARLPTP